MSHQSGLLWVAEAARNLTGRPTCVGSVVFRVACAILFSVGAHGYGSEEPDTKKSPTPRAPEIKPPAVVTKEASLEERLRHMEEMFRRMEEASKKTQKQYESLLKRYDELNRKVQGRRDGDTSRATATRPEGSLLELDPQEPPAGAADEGLGAQGTGGRTAPDGSGLDGIERRGPAIGAGMPGGSTGPGASGAGTSVSRRQSAGIGAQGTEGRVFPPETAQRGEEKPERRAAKVFFAEGLELMDDSEEFKLTFHNLTQAEYRQFPISEEGILKSQFFIPRQRWYFTGRVTRNVEYYTVINRGYGSLDLLDAFISYRIDERLRIRAGRMKTPFLYEYYSIAEGDLISPERSLFAGNLAGNRQMGVMALGELYGGRLGYAAGIFNGPRRSFQDFNSLKDFIGEANSRPFLESKRFEALRYLNLGGSFMIGYQNDPTQPQAFRTANDETASSAADSLSPTFLSLNDNVLEQGKRTQWAGHAVWYYKSLTLLSEYGGGIAGYAHDNSRYSTYIPYNGYFVQATYFLTGEQLTRRVNVVKPRRDFNLARDKFGLGAVEVHARYSTLSFGKEVFTSGFADPNLWSNHAWATDIGLNWYLNFYTKLYLDWQHSEFGEPVVIGPGRSGPTRDLYWIRFQVFF